MINIKKYTDKINDDKFIIYLFHGVINTNDTEVRNYNNKHILSSDFRALLIELKKKGNPLSLDEVISYHKKNLSLPKSSYAITFDDGFENNFSVAMPILDELSTPATFYVSTNLIDNNLMTWIDQIEYCFEHKEKIKLNLPWEDSITELNNTRSKIKCLKTIRDQVKKNQALYIPDKVVKSIFDQCDLNLVFSNNHYLDQKMSWDQVNKLHNTDLFNVGGHSHNHLSLGSVTDQDMRHEIDLSINLLNKKANVSSSHYSYPEGQDIDYNQNVIDYLINNKIKCCPTAIEGTNDLKLDSLFHLKRIMVY